MANSESEEPAERSGGRTALHGACRTRRPQTGGIFASLHLHLQIHMVMWSAAGYQHGNVSVAMLSVHVQLHTVACADIEATHIQATFLRFVDELSVINDLPWGVGRSAFPNAIIRSQFQCLAKQATSLVHQQQSFGERLAPGIMNIDLPIHREGLHDSLGGMDVRLKP